MPSFSDISVLFADADSASLTEKFDAYLGALDDAPKCAMPGGPPPSASMQLEALMSSPELSKSISADTLASVREELSRASGVASDIGKDLTTTSPLSTGLVPYDLEAPAKLLTPRPTPLRNRLARVKGEGLARQYKRITGYTGTGTGGVGVTRPGITDSTTNTFGSLSFVRGPKITYAADEKTIAYRQFSMSDQVNWSAQFSGQGFQDIRQLSQTSVLYASMLMEERMILGGRQSGSGYSLAYPAVTGVAATARSAGAGETGQTATLAHVYVYVAAEGQWGESVNSTVLDSTALAATTTNVLDVTWTDVTGALGYRVYAGTTTGIANAFFCGRTGYNSFTINFTGGGTGGVPNAGAHPTSSDTSASSTDYDGILSILGNGTDGGYLKRVNSAFSTTNPGSEYQTAFASLYDSVKSDPDEVLFNGNDRKQLSDLLKTASSSNYRLTVTQDEIGGVVIGDVVTAIQNEVTGKVVQLTVHPWLLQGNTPILSWTLPIPDTEVSNTIEIVNVQDYMAVAWPVVQFTYDISSYWLGTLIYYAPAWSGLVQGIKQV